MTTIIGLRRDGVSWLASDSRSSAGDAVLPSSGRKIVDAGPWVIAYSGSRAVNHVVQEASDGLSGCDSIHALTRAIRQALAEDGFGKSTDAGSADFGQFCLSVASASGLWHVGSDFSYAEIEDGRPWSHGTGGCHAEGACAALLVAGWSPEDAMREAIIIASRYDPWTDDRVVVVSRSQKNGESDD